MINRNVINVWWIEVLLMDDDIMSYDKWEILRKINIWYS